MERDEKLMEVLRYFINLHEADAVMQMLDNNDFSGKDIISYLVWCDRRRDAGDAETEFENWLAECGRDYKVEWFRCDDDGMLLGTVTYCEHLDRQQAIQLACKKYKEIENCTVHIYKNEETIADIL